MSTLEVIGLYIYPVKSMRGIPLQRAQLTKKGLLNDRHWMVIRANGRFVTQRDIPRMAMLSTRLDEDAVSLSMQGRGAVRIPFDRMDGRDFETRVWNDVCDVTDQGEEVSDWLTKVLHSDTALHLVRMKPGFERPTGQAEVWGADTTAEFADAAPYLVANEASLDRLNDVLLANSLTPVAMNRFRPNIVVRGLEPFAEHQVDSLTHGNFEFRFCAPCKRCVITTIDQLTGMKDPHWQPFKTLQTINPMPGDKKAPAFAENAVLVGGDGQTICVGDRLAVVFR